MHTRIIERQMLMMFPRLAAATLVLLLAAVPVRAEAPKLLAKTGDWESFAYADKAGKVCYAASLPKRTLHAAKNRGPANVTVTHRPAEKSTGVVSVAGGYAYKKDAIAELDIDSAKFDLFTTGETAWARDDKSVVQAMLKGKSLVMHGTPAKGEATADTYSLTGFAAAMAEIGKACGVK